MGVIALSASIITLHSASSAAQLRLSWSDNSDNEEGFEIQRMSPETGFLVVAIVGTNATSYADQSLAAGSTYCYRIRAFNAEAISLYSNLGCATTLTTADPPPPPTTPSSPALLLSGLSANLVSPQFVGAPITFSAAAAGGVSPVQFKWWVYDGFVWRVAKDWDTSSTFVFNPTTHASYVIGLWARSSGNSSDSPENDAVLTLPFTLMPLSCPNGEFLAEFYNNSILSGNPTFTACDQNIGYAWIAGSGGSGLGSDNFSIRWTGRFPFSAGVHNFTATADDGIRVWVDSNLIIDGWIDQVATTYQATLDISEGEHTVQVDYYQNGADASTQFYWQRVVTSGDDYYVMIERESLTVEAPGVLGNDNELNGNPLAALLVSSTTNGSLALNPDGSFSYTPNPDFSGTDSFTYRADNGSTDSNVAMVTITLTPPPVCKIHSNPWLAIW